MNMSYDLGKPVSSTQEKSQKRWKIGIWQKWKFSANDAFWHHSLTGEKKQNKQKHVVFNQINKKKKK